MRPEGGLERVTENQRRYNRNRQLSGLEELIKQSKARYKFYEESHKAKIPKLEQQKVTDSHIADAIQTQIDDTTKKAKVNAAAARDMDLALDLLNGVVMLSDWEWWIGAADEFTLDYGCVPNSEPDPVAKCIAIGIESTKPGDKFRFMEACHRDDIDPDSEDFTEEVPFMVVRNERLYVHQQDGTALRLYGEWHGHTYLKDDEAPRG